MKTTPTGKMGWPSRARPRGLMQAQLYWNRKRRSAKQPVPPAPGASDKDLVDEDNLALCDSDEINLRDK